ncbi:hypothetical protein TRAPUB_1995 [Trametes pubescens]|uniref:Uncharacterized protein n=1 Tax=Trametes pubescens TaxID=154538 RepID=A0A1M2VHX5_TRAPU|nr:hypothetical protein TRAPUB_1995 [Trametes pubescens]
MTSPLSASGASDVHAVVITRLNEDGSDKPVASPAPTADAGPPPYDETSSTTGLRKVSVESDRGPLAMSPVAKATSGARLDTYLWDAAFGGAPGAQPRAQAVNGITLYSKKEILTGSYSVDPAIPNTHTLTDPDTIAAEREHALEAGRAENGWS